MSKTYRIILFVMAMYMYYLFIIDVDDPVVAIGKIILVAMLLVAMEVIRRGSGRVFDAHSKLEEIDKMDQEKFTKYIAELYRRQGYQIYVLQGKEKMGCDLKAYSLKDSICIKCVHADEDTAVDTDVISAAYSSIKMHKVKRCIIITNKSYTEDAQVLAKGNGVKTLDRAGLNHLIYQVVYKSNKTSEIVNPQEA